MKMNPLAPHTSHFKDDLQMSGVQRVPMEKLRGDPLFFEQTMEILKDNFKDPVPLLIKEFEQCNWAYLDYDGEKLKSFFLVEWSTLPLLGHEMPSIYLGLSAIRDEFNGTEEIRKLYSALNSDAYRWEVSAGLKLFLWSTVTRSSECAAIENIFSSLEPSMEGNYSEWSAQMAKAIRHIYFPEFNGKIVKDHPFLLRGVAPSGYRTHKSIEAKKSELFGKMGLDEQRGDRALFFARVRPLMH